MPWDCVGVPLEWRFQDSETIEDTSNAGMSRQRNGVHTHSVDPRVAGCNTITSKIQTIKEV